MYGMLVIQSFTLSLIQLFRFQPLGVYMRLELNLHGGYEVSYSVM